MTYDVEDPRSGFGPEELALEDWLDDAGPYVTLPASDEPDDDDE